VSDVVVLACNKSEIVGRWKEAFDTSAKFYEAHDRSKLIYLLRSHKPVVALIHLMLPELHDGEGVALLHSEAPETRLLVFSDIPNESEERGLLRVGMHGYLNTYASPRVIRKALSVIRSRDMWVSRRLMSRMFEELREHPVSREENSHLNSIFKTLTQREQEIALLLGAGNSNRSIAERLDITERTVKTHLTSVFEKTGTRDRVQLALLVCRVLNGQNGFQRAI